MGIWGGPPPKPELSSGGQGPCSTGFPCWVSSRNPSVSVYQLVLLWEAASVNFLGRLSTHFLISRQVICECTQPHCIECSAVLTKNGMTPLPQPPYSPDLVLSNSSFVCFPGWKNFSKGNVLLIRKRRNKKMAEALKGMKIDKFKHCFEQWETRVNRCIASNGENF